MTGRALIISHGQPSDPEVGEREIAEFAARVAQHLPGWQVRGATLAAPGAAEAASAEMPGALVYPMFMADGWFTRVQLPKRLGAGAGTQLAPFGLEPGLPGLASDWIASEISAQGWRPEQTSFVIAGHGSGKSRRVADITRDFANRVAERLGPREVRCGFVEEDPRLVDVLSGLGAEALCLPFFATRRGHVLDDLPEAVAAARFAGLVLDPIGLHPRVPELVAQSLAAGV